MNSDNTRREANEYAIEQLTESDPVITNVSTAGEVLPGMSQSTVLTSGPPLPWDEYQEGQRDAIIGGALYEGLAKNTEEANRRIRDGDIIVGTCHDYSCVGSMAGIYTASMPVFVVRDRHSGQVGYCNFYEGESTQRLNYGVYNEEIYEQLEFISNVIATVIDGALKIIGEIELRPIIQRALHMGDELHSRNTAATMLISQELFPGIISLSRTNDLPAEDIDKTIEFLAESNYFFLRPGMAAGKATADAAHGIENSSIVTAMSFNCSEFGIRVSGLGDRWFTAPMPMVDGEFFDGFSEEDVEYMGGESIINETVGLGGLAQAAAFPLQDYQGGSPERMIEKNRQMYHITNSEHPYYKIPYFQFRGTPVGIDIVQVVEEDITPVMDIGVSGDQGGQIGAGSLEAPIACFKTAYDELTR
jgi:hypothetical protein